MKKLPLAKSRGFTLVELLVVVILIAGLVALLFPLITRVRANATKTKCVEQFHQWGIAIGSYAGDNSGRYECGRLVAPVSYELESCTPYIEYWVPNLSHDGESYDRSAAFSEAVAIHRTMRCCPTASQEGQTAVTIAMLEPTSGVTPSIIRPKRGAEMNLSSIKRPNRFMLMVETTAGNNADGYTIKTSQFTKRVQPLGMKSEDNRHHGIINCLLADFSVQSMNWPRIEDGIKYWATP